MPLITHRGLSRQDQSLGLCQSQHGDKNKAQSYRRSTTAVVAIFLLATIALAKILLSENLSSGYSGNTINIVEASNAESTSEGASAERIFFDCSKVTTTAQEDGGITSMTSTKPSFSMSTHLPGDDIYISAEISHHGCFGCAGLKSVLSELEKSPDAVLIDLGANIGLFSLAAAAMGRDAYGFEPVQKNYERLCQTVNANEGFADKVHLVPKAVTDVPTVVNFFAKNERNKGGIRVVPTTAQNATSEQEGVEYAYAIRVDSIAHVLPTDRPIVLKADVEGFECPALAGSMDYLNKVKIEYAIIEWSHERLLECEARKEIFDLLFHKNGLLPYLHKGAHTWDLLDVVKWEEWKHWGSDPDSGLIDVSWSKEPPTFED